MSGKNLRLNPLESRKQLLLAESELNRAQLIQDWRALTHEVRALASRAGTVGSYAAVAASLLGGLASSRSNQPPPAAEKPSWWKTVLNGVSLASACWRAFRPPRPNQPGT